MSTIILAQTPTEGIWVEIDTQKTVEILIGYMQEKREAEEVEKLSAEFEKVVQKTKSENLIDFLYQLMFASGKNLDHGIQLMWFVKKVRSELEMRCAFFDKAHPVPRL